MTHLRKPRTQRGFTIIELMVSVAVLAIAMAIAIPSFQELMANQRVKAAADALATSVMYARTEAIKRNASTRLVRSGSEWGGGWSVIIKSDGVSLRNVKPTGAVISGLGDGVIEISRSGRLSDSLTLTVCDAGNHADKRVVVISFSGMTRVTRGGRCGT